MIRSDDYTCPDWRRLAEDRDRDADGEARWRLGLEHAAGCPACREELVAIDPLAIFSLAPLAANRQSDRHVDRLEFAQEEVAEVEAMLQAVTAVRRHQVDRQRTPVRWLPWAAGALFCLSLAWFARPGGVPGEGGASQPEAAVVAAETGGRRFPAAAPDSAAVIPVSNREQTVSEPVALGFVTVGAALASTEAGSSLESIDALAAARASLEALTPKAAPPRVYRWQDRDLSIVMIVDEALDV